MGKIGFGYGSEWQLMRMMGRHGNYFDKLVYEEIKRISPESNLNDIEWFDFKYRNSQDSEWLGRDLFQYLELGDDHPKILSDTNWDIVGKSDYIYLLGEAKGRIKVEFEKDDKSGAGLKSLAEYKDLIEGVLDYYDISNDFVDAWVSKAFQLGNRIAMNYYLKRFNITSKIIYIFFTNDWKYVNGNDIRIDDGYSVSNSQDWIDSFNRMIAKLGFVTTEQKSKLFDNMIMIFPDCTKD